MNSLRARIPLWFRDGFCVLARAFSSATRTISRIRSAVALVIILRAIAFASSPKQYRCYFYAGKVIPISAQLMSWVVYWRVFVAHVSTPAPTGGYGARASRSRCHFFRRPSTTAEIQYAEETPAGVTGLRRVFVELYSPKMLLHLSETGFRQIGSASPER